MSGGSSRVERGAKLESVKEKGNLRPQEEGKKESLHCLHRKMRSIFVSLGGVLNGRGPV